MVYFSSRSSLPPGADPPLLGARPQPSREPLTPGEAEDLLLIGGFLRRPPPELKVLGEQHQPPHDKVDPGQREHGDDEPARVSS